MFRLRLFSGIEAICILFTRIAVDNLINLGYELDWNEWFSDEMPAVIQDQDLAPGIAGHQDHSHFWPDLLQLEGNVWPGYVSHHYVGKQQIDLLRLACKPDCIIGSGGCQHPKSCFFQNRLD